MDLSNTCKKTYVPAGSLMESVIVISLITICLFVALKMQVTIMDSKAISDDYDKSVKLNELVSRMKMDKDYNDKVFHFDTYSIHKSVTAYKNAPSLLKVTFSLKTGGKSTNRSYLILP